MLNEQKISQMMRRFCIFMLMAMMPLISTAACVQVGLADSHFFEITRPGYFCLGRDAAWLGEPFAWMDGGEKSAGGAVGYLGASNSELDLQKHSIVAKRLGVSALQDAAKRLTSDDYATGVSIRNGTLLSTTASGIVFDDLYGDLFFSLRAEVEKYCSKKRHQSCVDDWIKDELEPVRRMRNRFPRTGHIIDLMDVTAARSVVAIKGGGNTIRSSQLKVTGCAVDVYLIGTNQVIENNTIVVSGSRCEAADAPIKLHAGDNSIIRNNTIVIEGWGDKPEAAISLIDSKNVVIENNKIIGTKTLYKIWDEAPEQKSSVIERGNEFVSRLLGK